MTDLLGQQFGNYRLIRLLGQGGFAEVYLGEHVRLGMKAAIKVLQTHLLTQPQIDAFQHEARTVAELTHSHIVRVLDFDLQDGRPFLVLDYAPNGSLQKKHPRGTRVPLDQVVSYVQQVASALDYAHERKLIHRDVKPENLLIGKQGEILLSDFGIVTLAHSTSSMNTEAALGTLAYMAPEQIQGKPRKESDQYALAVTVYHWLTGTLPFGGSSVEIIAQHLGTPAPSLRDIRSDLPAEVDLVVLTALLKEPQWRYRSVQAFAEALTAASAQAPASSPPSLPAPVQPSDVTATQQANPAATAPGAQLSRTQPARPTLTPPVSTSAIPPIQPQRSGSPSPSRRGSLVKVACIFTLIVVMIGISIYAAKGNGTLNLPYRLSASDTGIQSINITPGLVTDAIPVTPFPTVPPETSTSVPPIITVTSLQLTANQTVIFLSLQGADTYDCTCGFALFRTSQGNLESPLSLPSLQSMGSLSPGDNEIKFADRPQAGEEWELSLILGDQSNGNAYVAYGYQYLYLQF